jgi:transketolase
VLIKKIRLAQNEYKEILKRIKNRVKNRIKRKFKRKLNRFQYRYIQKCVRRIFKNRKEYLTRIFKNRFFKALDIKLPNHIFKNIDLSYLFYLYGSNNEGIQQKLTNKFK